MQPRNLIILAFLAILLSNCFAEQTVENHPPTLNVTYNGATATQITKQGWELLSLNYSASDPDSGDTVTVKANTQGIYYFPLKVAGKLWKSLFAIDIIIKAVKRG